MINPSTYGTAELLREFLAEQYVNLDPENGTVRLVVSDFSIGTIIDLFRNNNSTSSVFDVNKYSWCVVESQWTTDQFAELAELIPNFNEIGPYQSLTEARNDTKLQKPAILLAPPLSDERESLKDLQHLNHSTIFDYFSDFGWVDFLVEVLGNASGLETFADVKDEFKLHERRLALLLTRALGRQDPLVRWCNAIWNALKLLSEDSEITCKSAIGRSLVAFKLFADGRLLDELADEKAVVRLNQNADEARLVRGGEISGRQISGKCSPAEQAVISGILDSPPDEFPYDIEFDWWQEHFIRNSRPPIAGLGDLVQARVDNYGSDTAQSAFTNDLRSGLNDGDVTAVEATLGIQDIYDCLTKSLRTKLENLVNPQVDATTGNFFAELQQILTQLLNSPTKGSPVKLTFAFDQSKWPDELPSRETLEGFLYLYIDSLRTISATPTLLGTIDISQLELDISTLLGLIDGQDDDLEGELEEDLLEDDSNSEPTSTSLETLTFNVTMDGENVQQIKWSPDAWKADMISGHLRTLPERASSLNEYGLKELANIYLEFFGTEIKNGMPSSKLIDDFCTNWANQIRKNREVFAKSRSACDLLLSLHTERSNSDAIVLFTHPERLRWLRSYLDRSATDIIDMLNGLFESNPENPGRYLDWMRDRTPVGIPAFLHGSNIRECLLPTVEGPLNSTYENILGRSRSDTQIPARFTNRIARVVGNFLDAYPFKKDRLSIAIFESSSSSPISASIVELVLKANQELSLSCDVFCQPLGRESILNNFTSNVVIADHNQRNQSQNSLKPPFELRLLNGTIDELPEFDQNDKYDLILLVDFFSQSPEATKKLVSHQTGNTFDGLTDESTHWQFLNADPIQFVKNLMPSQASSVLQEWSTLSIWVTENGPAHADNNEMTEFIQIQTGFNSQVNTYKEIHKYSNWVISLDQVLGRQQFETIPEPPEVLQIVQDLGVNASHTMIVSSQENRGVIRRIERNIRSKAPSFSSDAALLSKAAYETARELSPRQILSSGGESSTYLEVLGLAASYVHLTQSHAKIQDAREIWLSFDDMTDWFEFGSQSPRPDLLRILAHKSEELIHLDFMIIECKQREAMSEAQLTRARKQAEKGLLFVQSIVQAPEMNDNWMWRSDLASVLPTDQFDHEQRKVGAVRTIGRPTFELQEIGQSLRNGNFTTSLSAAVVRVGFTINELSDTEVNGVRMIKMPLNDVLSELSKMQVGAASEN